MEDSPEFGTKKPVKNRVRVDWYDSPNAETSQRVPIRRRPQESDKNEKLNFDEDVLTTSFTEEDSSFSNLFKTKTKNSALNDANEKAEEQCRLEAELKEGLQTAKKSMERIQKLLTGEIASKSSNNSVNCDLSIPTKAVESLVLNNSNNEVIASNLNMAAGDVKTPTRLLSSKLIMFTPPSAPLAHSTPKTGLPRKPMQPNNVENMKKVKFHDSFNDSFDDWDYAPIQKLPEVKNNVTLTSNKSTTPTISSSKQIVPETPAHLLKTSNTSIVSDETTHVSASFCSPKSTISRKRLAESNSGTSPIFKRIRSMDTSIIESPNTRLTKFKSYQPPPTALNDFEDDFYDDSPFD